MAPWPTALDAITTTDLTSARGFALAGYREPRLSIRATVHLLARPSGFVRIRLGTAPSPCSQTAFARSLPLRPLHGRDARSVAFATSSSVRRKAGRLLPLPKAPLHDIHVRPCRVSRDRNSDLGQVRGVVWELSRGRTLFVLPDTLPTFWVLGGQGRGGSCRLGGDGRGHTRAGEQQAR